MKKINLHPIIQSFALSILTLTLFSSISGAAPLMTEYNVPIAPPTSVFGLTSGPDGNMWFIDGISEKVVKLSSTGAMTTYQVSLNNSGATTHNLGLRIAAGPDGNMWFASTEVVSGTPLYYLDKITATGTITSYPFAITVNSNNSSYARGIYGIASGQDGNIWVAAGDNQTNSYTAIVKLNTSGTILNTYERPGLSWANVLTKGPDGNMWFPSVGKIVKVSTSGAFTDYAVNSNYAVLGLAAGPDGNMWAAAFTISSSDPQAIILKVTPSGTITEYPVQGSDQAVAIAAGPDGNMWFTSINNRVGVITPSGAMTFYALPTPATASSMITQGPDGNIWTNEIVLNNASATTKIVKVDLSAENPNPHPPIPPRTGSTTYALLAASGITALLLSAILLGHRKVKKHFLGTVR